MARSLMFGGAGVVVGLIVGIIALVVYVNSLIPWGSVCSTLVAAQVLAESGLSLIGSLTDWLDTAQRWLASGPTVEQTEQAQTGLGGLIDRAQDIAGDVVREVAESVTQPLADLIDVAKGVLTEVAEAVEAAQDLAASIDASRC